MLLDSDGGTKHRILQIGGKKLEKTKGFVIACKAKDLPEKIVESWHKANMSG